MYSIKVCLIKLGLVTRPKGGILNIKMNLCLIEIIIVLLKRGNCDKLNRLIRL
jgi:hypothetical protein